MKEHRANVKQVKDELKQHRAGYKQVLTQLREQHAGRLKDLKTSLYSVRKLYKEQVQSIKRDYYSKEKQLLDKLVELNTNKPQSKPKS